MMRFLAFISIIILAVSLRLHNLDARGPFTDEKFTLLNANGFWAGAFNQPEIREKKYFTPSDFWQSKKIQDYFDAIAHCDFGTHFTYNVVLHYYMLVFGNSDYSIRLLSVAFNIIMLILIYKYLASLFKKSYVPHLAILFLAVEPLNIAQSHVARSYTLSFLLVIIASFLFLKIIENNKKQNQYLIFYAITIALGLLNHYLNFLVPVCHAIVFLLLKQNRKIWFKFIVVATFNALLMLWWFNYGGGYSSFEFLKDKNAKHLKLAQNAAKTGIRYVELSTPSSVVKKSLNLFFESNALTHGIYQNLNGVKNVSLSFICFLILLVVFYAKKNHKDLIQISLIFVWLGLLFYFKNIAEGIIVTNCLFLALFFSILCLNTRFLETKFKIIVSICLLMLIIPILFVINDALKNGHTTSLVHRYIGISSPFVAVLLAIGLSKLYKEWKLSLILIGCSFWISSRNLKTEIMAIYDDKSGNYAWFQPARIKNPYKKIADIIKISYNVGDTILIPTKYQDATSIYLSKEKNITYTDAQFLNLYLPKNSTIIERIEPNEQNKFMKIDKNGVKSLLFDFEGNKYRY